MVKNTDASRIEEKRSIPHIVNMSTFAQRGLNIKMQEILVQVIAKNSTQIILQEYPCFSLFFFL